MTLRQNYFNSNGKLLLSGEYLVLHGAKALAIPLNLGQDLQIEILQESENPTIYWSGNENKLLWFEMSASMKDLSIQKTSDIQIANKLLRCLKIARVLNPDFLNLTQNLLVQTNLQFNRYWGLGSSSTLINNIASWAKIDPFKLLDLTFGGSGYDIACASADYAIFYTKDDTQIKIENANFNPEFKDQLYFVYLGQKQDTSKSIHHFEKMGKIPVRLINEISEIGILMAQARNVDEFNTCVKNHESILSSILKLKKVKQERFANFDGEIKSLGAWGGDFVLASSNVEISVVKKYFKQQKLEMVFKYSDLIK